MPPNQPRAAIKRFKMKPAAALRLIHWALLAFVLATLGRAWADDGRPLDLDETRTSLAAAEKALRDPNIGDADLQELRTRNAALGIALQGAVSDLTPLLAASTKRLAELTPKSGETAPATDVAAKELAGETKRHDTLDANLRAARAMLLQSDDLATRISAARRQVFARQTFARSSSAFDPGLWSNVGREAPIAAGVMRSLIGNWFEAMGERLTDMQKAAFAAILVGLVIAAALITWATRRFVRRDPAATAPSRFHRAIAAGWVFVILAMLPLIGIGLLVSTLDAYGLTDLSVQGFVNAILDAARALVVVNALARGILAPGLPAWRLGPMSDRTAAIAYRAAMAIAAMWAVERLIEPAADAVASLNIAVAARAVGATLVALVIAYALRRFAADPDRPASPQSDPWAPARTLGWAFAILVLGAALAGYIAFAAFLVNQALYLTILGALLYLIDRIVQDGTDALLAPDGAIGARLMALLGLRRSALGQIVVVVQGLARIAVVVIAIGAALEPWGVESQDMSAALRSAYFGFSVGGVTISLSSLVGAVAVFAVFVFLTRLFQDWLGSQLLPQTRLDAGVRNSVRTIVGWAGVIVAVLLAGAQIGLDVQKLALIAGGLSVGIGFGLQTIANNFVSGLILLWERSIRVGDWVVVGNEQGFVRAINARSTEIETFDRGSLIVPNANLVTGVVKNWVRADRVGRIVVAVNVAYESDLEVVRELLIAAAKAQGQVLSIPAPTVLLAEFGDWALKFQLICFVEDIELGERARSDIHFEALRRMREAGLRIPYPALPPPASL